jgi:hypothetical protein
MIRNHRLLYKIVNVEIKFSYTEDIMINIKNFKNQIIFIHYYIIFMWNI